jgi:hypothetical protein
MNKKRKILTVVGLIAFGAIIFFHYYSFGYYRHWYLNSERYVPIPYLSSSPVIEDVRISIFVLAVFYAGLFALLGDSKRKE